MDKYDLFNLTEKGISSAIINNIILSGIDLSTVEANGFDTFFEQTGIKKEDVYKELCMLLHEAHHSYNIFALTSCGVSDKVCQSLKKKGITQKRLMQNLCQIL